MRQNVFLALAGLALPALALAGQPMLVRVDGQTLPMREVVQVMHTAAGPVRVRTWTWHGPGGMATLQVSESRDAGPAVPAAWAIARMRAMQAQMRLLEAMLARPLPMPAPRAVAFGPPLLEFLPGQAPVTVRFLQPMIPLRPQPARVFVILPAPPPRAAPPTSHTGQRV